MAGNQRTACSKENGEQTSHMYHKLLPFPPPPALVDYSPVGTILRAGTLGQVWEERLPDW